MWGCKRQAWDVGCKRGWGWAPGGSALDAKKHQGLLLTQEVDMTPLELGERPEQPPRVQGVGEAPFPFLPGQLFSSPVSTSAGPVPGKVS